MTMLTIGRSRQYAYDLNDLRKNKLRGAFKIAIECQWTAAMQIALDEQREDADYHGQRVCPRYVAQSIRQGKTLKQIKALITFLLSDDGIPCIVDTIHGAAQTEFIYKQRNTRG